MNQTDGPMDQRSKYIEFSPTVSGRALTRCLPYFINPFPHDKNFYQTELKSFADDKQNVTKMTISVMIRVENIVRKKENACTSNFSFSLNVFKRLLS